MKGEHNSLFKKVIIAYLKTLLMFVVKSGK